MIDILKYLEALDKPTSTHEQLDYIVDVSGIVAGAIADTLNLKIDEVSVLLLSDDEKFLHFLIPRVLYNNGSTFPVGMNSIAGSSIVFHRSSIYNDLKKIHNLSFFEKVKENEKNAPLPIQKMATVPIALNDKFFGIVQISRKAKTFEQAGPNFEKKDLEAIQDYLIILANVIKNNHDFKL